jgi:hypothetical protein
MAGSKDPAVFVLSSELMRITHFFSPRSLIALAASKHLPDFEGTAVASGTIPSKGLTSTGFDSAMMQEAKR